MGIAITSEEYRWIEMCNLPGELRATCTLSRGSYRCVPSTTRDTDALSSKLWNFNHFSTSFLALFHDTITPIFPPLSLSFLQHPRNIELFEEAFVAYVYYYSEAN